MTTWEERVRAEIDSKTATVRALVDESLRIETELEHEVAKLIYLHGAKYAVLATGWSRAKCYRVAGAELQRLHDRDRRGR